MNMVRERGIIIKQCIQRPEEDLVEKEWKIRGGKVKRTEVR